MLLASFNVPVMVKAQFKGIPGADLSGDFIEQILLGANSELYNGAGQMAIISDKGSLVALPQMNPRWVRSRTGIFRAPCFLALPARVPVTALMKIKTLSTWHFPFQ